MRKAAAVPVIRSIMPSARAVTRGSWDGVSLAMPGAVHSCGDDLQIGAVGWLRAVTSWRGSRSGRMLSA